MWNNKYIVADFETSDAYYRGDIIAGCLLKLDEFKNKIDQLDFKVRPLQPNRWDRETESVHGFTLEEAMTFNEPKEIADRITSFLSDKGKYHWVDHSDGAFDKKYLNSFFMLVGGSPQILYRDKFDRELYSSTMKMGREYKGVTISGVSKKDNLKVWCKHFGIDLEHHNCVSDAHACAELFRIFDRELNELRLI